MQTCAKEVCKALEYQRRTKDILRGHVRKLKGVVFPNTPLECPKNSQPDEYYLKKECMRCSLEVNSRKHVSIENIQHQHQLKGWVTATQLLNDQKTRKNTISILFQIKSFTEIPHKSVGKTTLKSMI